MSSSISALGRKDKEVMLSIRPVALEPPSGGAAMASGYTGVRQENGAWIAEILIRSNLICLGKFDSALEAALAYDMRAARAGMPENIPDGEEGWAGDVKMHQGPRETSDESRMALSWLVKSPRKDESATLRRGTGYVLVDNDGCAVMEYATKEEAARDLEVELIFVKRHLNGTCPRVAGKRLCARTGGPYHAADLLTCNRCGGAHQGSFESGHFCSSACKEGNSGPRGLMLESENGSKLQDGNDEVSQKLDANADASFERPLERQNGVSNESLSSHYKGVGWDKSKNKWKVSITKDGKRSHLGYFTDEKEAARRYAEAIPPLGRPLDFPEEPIDSWKFSSSACQGGHIGQQDLTFKSDNVAMPQDTDEVSQRLDKKANALFDRSRDRQHSASQECTTTNDFAAAIHKRNEATADFEMPKNFVREEGCKIASSGGSGSSLQKPTNFTGGESRELDPKRGNGSSSSSMYTGVSWNSRDTRWASVICRDGKRSHLGCFSDEKEAARRYDEAAALLGKPVNFPQTGQKKAIARKKRAKQNMDITLHAQHLGQRINAALVHCSEGPSLAVAALRSWIPPLAFEEHMPRAPLGLVAGVKLLCSRMSEEPSGGWVALVGGSAPPHGTEAWRSTLCQAGLGRALADICRHWSGDAQLIESCLDAFGYLTEAPNHAPVLSNPRGLISSKCEGMGSVVDQALAQFSSCTKKGWLTVLGKLFEVVSHIAHSNGQQDDEKSIQGDFCRMAPVLVLALKQAATSGGSLPERKALVKWCGRAVRNVLSGAVGDGRAKNNTSQVLFEAGVLDAALVACRAFSDSRSVQYWGLKTVVAILHLNQPARVKAAELGAGRVAAAAINR
jgi:hypothetical protein